MPTIDAKSFLNEGNVGGIDFFIANRKKILRHIIDWQVKEEELNDEKREAEKELKRLRTISLNGMNKREKIEVEKSKQKCLDILRKTIEIPIETEEAAFAKEHRTRLLQILEAQEALREKVRAPIEASIGFVLAPLRWVSDSLADRWEEFEEVSKEIRNLPKAIVDMI